MTSAATEEAGICVKAISRIPFLSSSSRLEHFVENCNYQTDILKNTERKWPYAAHAADVRSANSQCSQSCLKVLSKFSQSCLKVPQKSYGQWRGKGKFLIFIKNPELGDPSPPSVGKISQLVNIHKEAALCQNPSAKFSRSITPFLKASHNTPFFIFFFEGPNNYFNLHQFILR